MLPKNELPFKIVLLQLSTPSKTFLLGEYLALCGGASLIVNTEARFSLTVKSQSPGEIIGISSQGPARQLLQTHAALFKPFKLNFTDPYAKAGGLGASSAQFLLCYALHEYVSRGSILSANTIEIDRLLQHYHSCCDIVGKYKPSGHDLIAQLKGDLCYFHPRENKPESYAWPFKEIGFYLLRSGTKIATHEHLAQLQPFDAHDLNICMQQAMQAFHDQDPLNFIVAVNQYGQLLQQLGFVSVHTQALLRTIHSHKAVRATKGCGALGADIILVLIDKNKKSDFADHADQQGWVIIADESHISSGLSFIIEEQGYEMAG
ncbi:MAG: hypothetical protein V3V61_06320 [Gammaproteobacteria bacterium]